MIFKPEEICVHKRSLIYACTTFSLREMLLYQAAHDNNIGYMQRLAIITFIFCSSTEVCKAELVAMTLTFGLRSKP